MERAVGIALEHRLEDGAVEVEVPRLLGGHPGQRLAEQRLVLRHHLAGLGVRLLGGALLERGVDEDPVGVPVPLRVEAAAEVLELELLQPALVEDPRGARVGGEDHAVAVLLRGPEVGPVAPDAVVAEVDREDPVEVREAFLGEEVERQRGPGVVRDARGPGAEVVLVPVGVLSGPGTQQVLREPELALLLVAGHQAGDHALEVAEHRDAVAQLAVGVGEAHRHSAVRGKRTGGPAARGPP